MLTFNDPSIAPRVWEKLRITDRGCWEWCGTRTKPYVQLRSGGKSWQLHRLTWTLANGTIPEGLQIDHLCRNTWCSNPDHLEAVTPYENTMRSTSPSATNALKTHCPEGHEYTPENTLYNHRGCRNCRECNRQKCRAWWHKRHPEPPSPQTHCVNGHEFTTENTYIRPGVGNRQCRACKRDRKRAARRLARTSP